LRTAFPAAICHLRLNASEPAYRKHLEEVRRAIEDAAAAAKKRG
jgi:hypothetical protein